MTTYPKLSYTIVPYHLALGVAMAFQPLRASDHLYEASTSRYEDDKAVQSTNNDVQPNQDKPTHGMDTTRPKTSSRAKEKQDIESEQTNRNPILIAVGSAALVLGTAYRSWGGLYLTNTPNTPNTSNTFQPNEKPTPIVVYNVMTKNNTPQPRTKSKHDLTTNLPTESDIPNKKSPKEAQKHKKDFLTLQSLQSNTNQRPTSPKYENSSNNTKTDLRTKTFVGKTKQDLSKTHLLNNADSTDNGRKASVATSLSHRTFPPLSEVEGTGGTFDENMNSNTNSKPVIPPPFNHASAPTAYTNMTQNDNQSSFGYPILLPKKTSHDTLNISPISPQQPFQMPFNNQGSPTMQNVMTQDNNNAPNKGNTLNTNHNAFGSNVNSSVPNNISENESNTEPKKSDNDTSNDDTNGDNTTENEPNTDDENNTEVNTQETLNNKPETDNKSTSKKNDNQRSIKSWFKNTFKNKGNKNKDQKNVTEPTDNTNTQEVSNNTPENEHENSTSIDTQTMSDSHSKNDTKDKLELKSKKEKKKLEKERKKKEKEKKKLEKERKKKEKKLLKEQEKQKKKNNVNFIKKMKIKLSKKEPPPYTKPV